MDPNNEKLWRGDELADAEFDDPIFLIDPLIPMGGKVLLHGKPGLGKTQLALSLADAVVRGDKWLGKWQAMQGRVVFVQADMPAQLQHLRLQRLKQSYLLSPIFFTMPYGLQVTHMERTHPNLCHRIRDVDPAMIVWDTLTKIHRMNESDSLTSQRVYEATQESFPRATHFFIHHDRKDSQDPRASAPKDESFRGSEDWKASADTTFGLEAHSTGQLPKRILLQPHKARAAPDHEKSGVLLEMDPWTIALHSL